MFRLDDYIRHFDNPEQAKETILSLQLSEQEGNLARDFASHAFYKILIDYFNESKQQVQERINSGECKEIEQYWALSWALKFLEGFEFYVRQKIEQGEESKDRLRQVYNDRE